MTISVLGEGAWGTAFAYHLAHNGHEVTLWCHDPEVAHIINTTHTNPRFMPGITLHPLIYATSVIQQAVHEATWVFEAIPVQFLRPLLMQARLYTHKDQVWVLLSKGIEAESLLFPSQILSTTVGTCAQYLILSGPSFARELVNKQLTGMIIAEEQSLYTHKLQSLIASDWLQTKTTTDSIGVQAAGALKNCIALGAGILATVTQSDNTRGFYFTQISLEVTFLIKLFGGIPATFYTLAGIGDTCATALSMQSKNTQIGHLIGTGKRANDILGTVAYIPESLNTLKAVHELIQKQALTLPIFQTLYAIVYDNQAPTSLLSALTHSLSYF